MICVLSGSNSLRIELITLHKGIREQERKQEHYENMPVHICIKFHLQKLKSLKYLSE